MQVPSHTENMPSYTEKMSSHTEKMPSQTEKMPILTEAQLQQLYLLSLTMSKFQTDIFKYLKNSFCNCKTVITL